MHLRRTKLICDDLRYTILNFTSLFIKVKIKKTHYIFYKKYFKKNKGDI